MVTIEDHGGAGYAHFKKLLVSMPDAQLLVQDLVQQGAVHAISSLLAQGCTEERAATMLASLREMAVLIRQEAARRGKPSLFERDQTPFQ